MARAPKKPGTSGHAVNYMTRQQALKKLQISLADFRRLCILKGVYPRDPSKKVKGKDKTYYATKDILFLLHEPVLDKLRQIKTHLKKLTKAKAHKDHFRVKLLESRRPFYLLDHLVKERFPSFTDAVRDMDDALSMVTLYAYLPSTSVIKSERTQNCKRLCYEFKNWIVKERALRKVFLSIKGCYFQAQVQGQAVTWLVPYQFSQELPEDVDYNVMRTFLEFYETQLHFINYKLYASLGLVYPPKIDAKLDAADAGLSSYKLVKVDSQMTSNPADNGEAKPKQAPAKQPRSDAKIKSLEKKLQSIERSDAAHPEEGQESVGEDLNAMMNDGDDEDTSAAAAEEPALFDGLKFFISREVPRHIFEFVVRAFGGRVGWEGEGSPFPESDESITHQVVDRDTQRHYFLSREYVQPQWLADCANAGLLLPVTPYGPGKVPPPHISPFVDDAEEGYIPDQRRYILDLQDKSRRHGDGAFADEAAEAGAAAPRADGEEDGSASDEGAAGSEDGGDDDEDEEGEAARRLEAEYRKELEAESQGRTAAEAAAEGRGGKKASSAASKAKRAAAEEEARAKMMMPKKDKRLYEKIQFAKQRKEDRVRLLRSRKE